MPIIETIGDATLYLGDCRDILPTLGPVDAVVTDPPYGIINRFGVQNKKNGVRRLQFDWDNYLNNDDIIGAIVDAVRKAPSFFVFCGMSQISHIEATLIGDFTVKPAVWIKACPPPALSGNWWPSGFEFALYGYRTGAWFGDDDSSRVNVFYTDTYRHSIRANEKVDHPTQKWLPLMEKIVSSVVPSSGICLDPFMGSGTTGVACAKLGRKFIGIEIEPKYFDIACRRIEDAQRQGDFFTPPKQEMTQLRLAGGER